MDGCFHAFPLFYDCEGGIVTSKLKLRSKLNVLRSDLEDGDMGWVSIPSSVGLLRVFSGALKTRPVWKRKFLWGSSENLCRKNDGQKVGGKKCDSFCFRQGCGNNQLQREKWSSSLKIGGCYVVNRVEVIFTICTDL